ncbi:5,6-dimethylbenzimidazole synthase [Corallincola luteus]|uniref:5,6-dimethylbenzimidazole synthase n=2 Tax=Corallincola TaxID=1775176 RepID=A0A368NJ45_9GAMM|nr:MULTISPECIES: 5,6-dimethylbenzimidazole synthase [Corallincola]RCU49391.1 5,6-dimethylbenzimidazole synthase [Corallincola holothuriorum]TCI01564.1 5,6-dimethylbenzimidazole synthase [Corallincola luteus]
MAPRGRFSAEFADAVESVIQQRRDIRGNHFTSKPIPDAVYQRILNAGLHAPSVGFSQPWRFVTIKEQATKEQISDSFEQKNREGEACFTDEKQSLYRRLKLEGIKESPINLAVFYAPNDGPVLGQTAMPDMGRFSVVCAIENMWLMARALNVGIGWVSILDPKVVKAAVKAPDTWELVGYLCLGYTDDFPEIPELKALGWDKQRELSEVLFDEVCPSNG